jgi:hypothetical protein
MDRMQNQLWYEFSSTTQLQPVCYEELCLSLSLSLSLHVQAIELPALQRQLVAVNINVFRPD